VQYFNQNTSKYANYNEIFIQAAGEYQGTAVSELIRTGIDQKKIVVGKPVTPTDATSGGWIDPSVVGEAVSRAYN
jgi:chitinase